MILAFETEELRTICEDADAARERLGEELAAVLRIRIADLRAADSIEDLLVGQTSPRGTEHHLLDVELTQGVVMTFVSNHNQPRTTDTGAIDWPRVQRIRLVQIGSPS